jgi:hypothetical protein
MNPRMLAAMAVAGCTLGIAYADTIKLSDGRTLSGQILQTNGVSIVIQTDLGTFNYPLNEVKEVTQALEKTSESRTTGRMLTQKGVVLLLSKQPWASNLKQIPATVIDRGILRNIPYVSYRCGGGDYEVNVYGDPDEPAGIEVGVYGKLLGDAAAKQNCLGFALNLLGQSEDRVVVKTLKLDQDERTYNGLTFEITPPTAEDSYMGWWVSIYSKEMLDRARASDEELKQITVSKVDAAAAPAVSEPAIWSKEEMKLSRPTPTNTITYTNLSGEVFADVEVVRVIAGTSLIWRKGNSAGSVKLADLPEDVRRRYGYDPEKASAADQAEKDRKAREQAEIRASQAARQTPPQSPQQPAPSKALSVVDYGLYLPPSGSSGSVYVRGYTRKDGTYVSGYTRRK